MELTQRRRGQASWMIRAVMAGALMGGAMTAMTAMAEPTSPAGKWQTIDDSTGQPRALVEITDSGDGTLNGKIVTGLGADKDPTRRCTACTDSRKDQLMQGMTIIDGMKPDRDGWDGGRILDPENGKLYKCKMHLEEGGQKLVVRGYIGVSLLGRSQTWIRQE